MNSNIAQRLGGGFPRTARLLKHSDFERVYKQGKRQFSANMTVFYLRRGASSQIQDPSSQAETKAGRPGAAVPTLAETGARVGLTVGKALGGAVVRNRIKRRMREAVRMRRQVLPAGLDVVINPKKAVLTLEFTVVLEEVGRALEAVAKKAESR